MGQQPSIPDPNAQMRVIGCGLPRTASASFAAALEIVLKGPVYHGGTQLYNSKDGKLMDQWIRLNEATPIKSDQDRNKIKATLREILTGFAGCSDVPVPFFVEELAEEYPDAVFICTTRDPEKWWKSWKAVFSSNDPTQETANETFLKWALFWVPAYRRWVEWSTGFHRGRFGEVLFHHRGSMASYPEMYQVHIDYLKRSLPEDRLFFFDVKDGWEPLCQILDCEVPDVPFPHINDGAAFVDMAQKVIRQGLISWAAVGAATAVSAGFLFRYWRRR